MDRVPMEHNTTRQQVTTESRKKRVVDRYELLVELDREERKVVCFIALMTVATEVVQKYDKVCTVTTSIEVIEGDEELQTYYAITLVNKGQGVRVEFSADLKGSCSIQTKEQEQYEFETGQMIVMCGKWGCRMGQYKITTQEARDLIGNDYTMRYVVLNNDNRMENCPLPLNKEKEQDMISTGKRKKRDITQRIQLANLGPEADNIWYEWARYTASTVQPNKECYVCSVARPKMIIIPVPWRSEDSPGYWEAIYEECKAKERDESIAFSSFTSCNTVVSDSPFECMIMMGSSTLRNITTYHGDTSFTELDLCSRGHAWLIVKAEIITKYTIGEGFNFECFERKGSIDVGEFEGSCNHTWLCQDHRAKIIKGRGNPDVF